MTEAELLREQARKCRWLANSVSDTRSRDVLRQMADEYDERASACDPEGDGNGE